MSHDLSVSDAGCPECRLDSDAVSRRSFLQTVGATAVAAASSRWPASARAADEAAKPQSETLVKTLYETLTPLQKEELCYPWDYTDDRGLLRTRVQNNWFITDQKEWSVGSDKFTKDQKQIIRDLFLSLYNEEWRERILKQLQDDAGGYGNQQTFAIFGQPGSDKFEFVMTGRHVTIRCDGNTTDHVALGGPIFYGHAASGFNEKPGHPNNVYWHQAVKAGELFKMLDGKQQALALVEKAPSESKVAFKGKGGDFQGIPLSELSKDQLGFAQEVLKTLLAPYRQVDRDEAVKCLDAQGGLEGCRLAFFKEGNLEGDDVWDVWRLEGPAFVWHFRGTPHVHVWANIADDSSVATNAAG